MHLILKSDPPINTDKALAVSCPRVHEKKALSACSLQLRCTHRLEGEKATSRYHGVFLRTHANEFMNHKTHNHDMTLSHFPHFQKAFVVQAVHYKATPVRKTNLKTTSVMVSWKTFSSANHISQEQALLMSLGLVQFKSTYVQGSLWYTSSIGWKIKLF